MSMEERVSGTASRQTVLDNKFDSLNDESFIYVRDAYDRFAREADSLSRYLSHAAGWKSDRRHLDFGDFEGSCLSCSEGMVSFKRSGEEVGSVSRGPEGVVIEGFIEAEFRNADGTLKDAEDICREIAAECVSESNVKAFRAHTTQGHQVMFSLDFGDKEVFSVHHRDDLDQLFRIFSSDARVKFVDERRFQEVFGGILKESGANAPEEPLPQLRIYLFDGRSIFGESQKVECFGVDRQEYELDRQMNLCLRDRLMDVRRELEDMVRVLPEDRDFSFAHAVHPSLGFRDDVVFLKSRGGADYETCCFYCGGIPVVEREDVRIYAGKGQGIDAFVGMIRDSILSPENVNRAKLDYASYRQSLSTVRSNEHGRSM